jgi:hypothetical protein
MVFFLAAPLYFFSRAQGVDRLAACPDAIRNVSEASTSKEPTGRGPSNSCSGATSREKRDSPDGRDQPRYREFPARTKTICAKRTKP